MQLNNRLTRGSIWVITFIWVLVSLYTLVRVNSNNLNIHYYHQIRQSVFGAISWDYYERIWCYFYEKPYHSEMIFKIVFKFYDKNIKSKAFKLNIIAKIVVLLLVKYLIFFLRNSLMLINLRKNLLTNYLQLNQLHQSNLFNPILY